MKKALVSLLILSPDLEHQTPCQIPSISQISSQLQYPETQKALHRTINSHIPNLHASRRPTRSTTRDRTRPLPPNRHIKRNKHLPHQSRPHPLIANLGPRNFLILRPIKQERNTLLRPIRTRQINDMRPRMPSPIIKADLLANARGVRTLRTAVYRAVTQRVPIDVLKRVDLAALWPRHWVRLVADPDAQVPECGPDALQ